MDRYNFEPYEPVTVDSYLGTDIVQPKKRVRKSVKVGSALLLLAAAVGVIVVAANRGGSSSNTVDTPTSNAKLAPDSMCVGECLQAMPSWRDATTCMWESSGQCRTFMSSFQSCLASSGNFHDCVMQPAARNGWHQCLSSNLPDSCREKARSATGDIRQCMSRCHQDSSSKRETLPGMRGSNSNAAPLDADTVSRNAVKAALQARVQELETLVSQSNNWHGRGHHYRTKPFDWDSMVPTHMRDVPPRPVAVIPPVEEGPVFDAADSVRRTLEAGAQANSDIRAALESRVQQLQTEAANKANWGGHDYMYPDDFPIVNSPVKDPTYYDGYDF